jgi:molybdenum cofactor synthesis domain-containing protein
VATAAIVTIGNELVSGDTHDTNAPWLARRLEQLGVEVRLIASVPDELEAIVPLVRSQSAAADVVVVTGGLGGTPDDLTREALAAAFGVGQEEVPEVAAALRARFRRDPEYAVRWAQLPVGSRPLENPLGGAPGFALANVYVLPGLPSEMEAMFDTVAGELATGSPISAWRRRYRTTESEIVGVLEEMGERHPGVVVGSYPTFSLDGPEVEVVVKSRDRTALADAAAWIEPALEAATEQRP